MSCFHKPCILGILGGLLSSQVLAATDGLPEIINYYQIVASSIGLGEDYIPLLGSLMVLGLTGVIGLMYCSYTRRLDASAGPSERLSMNNIVELALEFLHDFTKEHCGPQFKRYLPLISGLFIFILLSNVSGLVPGLPPATESINTNLAMGGLVFLLYNLAGFSEHGLSYIKQFMGPFLALAVLFLPIELISHSVRPLSLAFRLQANIFCDHLLLTVFSGLVPLGIPTLFMFFGLMVAFVQSFVFILLTAIYINMAISHDH